MNLLNCIQKILTCSTAHITKEDNRRLMLGKGLPGSHVVYVINHGYLITVVEQDHVTDLGSWQLDGWSEAVYHLVNNALHRKCAYIRLDKDAETVTGWKTFEW